FRLPLAPAAVDQVGLLVAVLLPRPVRIPGDPVVVVAVEDDRRVGRDAAASQEFGQRIFRRDVAGQLVLEVALPVPPDGAFDVTPLVDGRVYVDLDHAKT